ncbi:MAG: hypothetical protein NW226_16415 [Microscillaceae bacterium]|nr:hypothetical protein [Microscillaceae bacterium]
MQSLLALCLQFFLIYYPIIYASTTMIFGQNKDQSSRELFFAKSHNRFEAGVYLSGGNTEREYGTTELESRLGFGFNFTWIHTKQINNAWAIEYGLGGGALPWKYLFEIEAGRVFEDNFIEYGTEYVLYIHAPLQGVYRKPIRENVYLNIRSGISLRYILEEILTVGVTAIDENSNLTPIFRAYNEFDNAFRVNFNLGIGVSWVLPYFDMLDFQLRANISPRQYIFNDYYFFPGAADETFGHYRSRGTYVGLTVGYIFTRVRKMIKRR